MAKSRKRVKIDDGLWAVHAMVPEYLEHGSGNGHPPKLQTVLVDLLNGDILTADSKQRVELVLRLLRFQSGYGSQLINWDKEPQHKALADAYFTSMVKCNMELNENLAQYRVIPQVHPIGEGPLLYFLSDESKSGARQTQAETGAIMCALQLADRDHLGDVRECSCGTFFVAKRSDNRHCSVKCRVKEHQSSEEFKAERRKKDRERYRLHQNGEVKESRRGNHGAKKAR